MSYDDMFSTGLQRQSGVDDMLQQGPSSHFVQHLRRVGEHALAFSGSKNDNFEGGLMQ